MEHISSLCHRFSGRRGRDVVSSDLYQFVSDLRQVGGFVRVLRFSPLIKLTAKILLKMALSTIKQTNIFFANCKHK
jgi:hypothetical protein